jgi:hypothetical protein
MRAIDVYERSIRNRPVRAKNALMPKREQLRRNRKRVLNGMLRHK